MSINGTTDFHDVTFALFISILVQNVIIQSFPDKTSGSLFNLDLVLGQAISHIFIFMTSTDADMTYPSVILMQCIMDLEVRECINNKFQNDTNGTNT